MKKPLFMSLLIMSLLMPKNIHSQEDDSATLGELEESTTSDTSAEELSEEPQTLPAPAAETQTPPPEATEVETLPPPTEVTNAESEKTPSPTKEESIPVKKSAVVPEDELMKTKAKKVEKVKAAKVSESEFYIQEADRYKLNETYKNLQLNDAIEQGLRKNYDQNIRAQKQELNQITFSGAKSAFWLPELKITLTTDDQKIANVRSSSRPPTSPHSTSPSGSLGLSLGDYTVFNWGKDYALYLNTKASFERNTQIYNETSRELKLDLINSFFSLMASKNIEKIRQDELRQASFVYRLSKEKITVGKTTKQDYYQARSEYLKAQNNYHDAKILADTADESIAFQIADPVGTKYIITESLDYKRLKMTLDEVVSFAEKNNPTLLTNKVTIDNAERSYDVALKENMPLPKFSMNLGAYSKRFGPTSNSTSHETYSGSGNVELVASINASWSLTGADGFLNSNKLATSRINKEIARKEFEKSTHSVQSLIRQTYKTIVSLQNQIVILEARLPSLQKTFDTILENYLAGRSRFYEFSMALDDLTSTKIYFEETKYQHLKEKLSLARLAGLEDFPGENFERLAQRQKGK